MKKLILIILIFSLTGCIKNEDFDKICKINVKTTHLNDNTAIYIVYNSDDVVKEATITKNYKAIDQTGEEIIKDIKSGIDEYNKSYGDTGIKYTLSKNSTNELEYKYYLPVQSLDDDILKDFKLKKNSIKLFNRFRKDNIECED